MSAPPWMDVSAISYTDAITALAEAVVGIATTSPAVPRQVVGTSAGQLLLMPAEIAPFAGVKVVSVAPDNPRRGLPRVNGVYTLFDAATLVPLAQCDAADLTAVRTAAVSALAVEHLAAHEPSRLVIIGTGPQAWAHLEALVAIRPLRTVTIVARTPERGDALARRARELGLSATVARADVAAGADASDASLRAIAAADSLRAIANADIVACCTTAREPLFDSALVRDGATVVAVGSHEPDARELDAALMRRAFVVVESRASAASAGELALAGGVGLVAADLGELVSGAVVPLAGRTHVFKSVGEAWEDLVVAAALYTRRHARA